MRVSHCTLQIFAPFPSVGFVIFLPPFFCLCPSASSLKSAVKNSLRSSAPFASLRFKFCAFSASPFPNTLGVLPLCKISVSSAQISVPLFPSSGQNFEPKVPAPMSAQVKNPHGRASVNCARARLGRRLVRVPFLRQFGPLPSCRLRHSLKMFSSISCRPLEFGSASPFCSM